jgi:lipopolysaccharide export system protein LptC
MDGLKILSKDDINLNNERMQTINKMVVDKNLPSKMKRMAAVKIERDAVQAYKNHIALENQFKIKYDIHKSWMNGNVPPSTPHVRFRKITFPYDVIE